MYLTGVTSRDIEDFAASEHCLGLMAQPRSAVLSSIPAYPGGYAADNGAFGAWLRGQPFNASTWRRYLAKLPPTGCLFAVVPDVVCDHDETRAMWDRHVPEVHAQNLPPAFVLQNGCDDIGQVPDDASAVFIGGDDDYKLGRVAARVTWQARERGLWVHMGRVNSRKRWTRALAMGCDSADGTFLRFEPPGKRLDRLRGMFREGRSFGGQLDLMDYTGDEVTP